MRKWIAVLLVVAFCIPLGGCWSYRGLDSIIIVLGIAIDKSETGENYMLSFEVVDLGKMDETEATKSAVYESEGKTIFDAIRNILKKVCLRLYFSDMQVLVISKQIAEQDGIGSIIEWFIKDGEPRTSINVVISQESTAKEILTNNCLCCNLISESMDKILDNNKESLTKTKLVAVYQAFNTLKSEGTALVLPAFHSTTNIGETVSEAYGTTVFKEDKLVGFLTPEETRYYLFVTDDVKGGILTVNMSNGNRDDVSLEITKSKTKQSYTYDGTRLKIKLEVKTTVFLVESPPNVDALDKEMTKKIQDIAQDKIEEQIKSVIQKVQSEFMSDIFGFGSMVYKKDPALWEQLKENGDMYFQAIEMDIKSEVAIDNSAFIR